MGEGRGGRERGKEGGIGKLEDYFKHYTIHVCICNIPKNCEFHKNLTGGGDTLSSE